MTTKTKMALRTVLMLSIGIIPVSASDSTSLPRSRSCEDLLCSDGQMGWPLPPSFSEIPELVSGEIPVDEGEVGSSRRTDVQPSGIPRDEPPPARLLFPPAPFPHLDDLRYMTAPRDVDRLQRSVEELQQQLDLRARLHAMDREHASQQAEGSQFVIDNLDDQVGKLSTALEDVKEQCKQLKAREQELLTRLAQQREELNKLQDAEATHLRHLGEAKQRAAELGASNEKLQQLVLHLRGEITGITTNMRARAATFVAEKKAWDKRVSELFNRLHEAEEAETQARLENTELAELLKASTSEVELMAAQIKALEQQGQDWRSITREEKDKHTQDVEQYMAREVELEGEIERRGLRIAALMRDAEEQRQLLDEQKAIVRGLTNMLDETEAAKGKQAAQAEGNFADLRVVADDYATQAAELSNALRALREEYAGMMHEKNGTITAREDELRRILEHNGALQAECARMVSEKESAIATMADEIKRARELNGALAGKAATRKGKIRTLDEQLAKLLRDLEQTRASLQTQTEEAVAAKQTLAQIRALSIGGL